MKNLIGGVVLFLMAFSAQAASKSVYLDFISIGTGIDSFTYRLSQDFAKTALEQGKVTEQTLKPWGREGERTFCVSFVKSFDAHLYIRNLTNSILSDASAERVQRTKVFLGEDCSDISKAVEQDLWDYFI